MFLVRSYSAGRGQQNESERLRDILPAYDKENRTSEANETSWRVDHFKNRRFDGSDVGIGVGPATRNALYLDLNAKKVGMTHLIFREAQRDFVVVLYATNTLDFNRPLLSRTQDASKAAMCEVLSQHGVTPEFKGQSFTVEQHPLTTGELCLFAKPNQIQQTLAFVELLMEELGSNPEKLMQDMQAKVDYVLDILVREGVDVGTRRSASPSLR